MATRFDRDGGALRDRPTGELVRDLSQQVSTLVRQELQLAKFEVTEKGKKAGIGAGMLGAGGVVALFGVGALVACAIIALATAVADWLAALIVGVVLLAVAGVLALMGKTRAAEASPPVPRQAIDTTRKDVEATKAAIQEARR
jgi:uncharacterized membrane protein YqjE